MHGGKNARRLVQDDSALAICGGYRPPVHANLGSWLEPRAWLTHDETIHSDRAALYQRRRATTGRDAGTCENVLQPLHHFTARYASS